MIFNNQEQTLLLFLRSFLFGLMLGALYDVFSSGFKMWTGKKKGGRVLRGIALFFFDFLFCLICALCALLLMYYSNGGFFRALVFGFLFLGFVCFRCSVGILWRRLWSMIYRLIRRLLLIILIPVKFIKDKLILLYHLTIGKILGKIVSWYKLRQQKREEKKLKAQELPQIPQEELLYVAPGRGYKKSGRIKF